jgi:peptidoglycan/xylan/chitin deacetylase (PgdA/CDA1 family)
VFASLKVTGMHCLLKYVTPVLLYHTTFQELPQELAAKVHNVRPEIMADQLSYLKRRLRFVCIDELISSRSPRGLAAITFDDGYKCVIDLVADLLISLEIPFTIFVNSCTMEHKVFWRDKVRYIMSRGLVEECEQSLSRTRLIKGRSFYRYTKDPINDSRTVDEELDRFLAEKGVALAPGHHAFDNPRYFLKHPLVSYGNHSHHHYVLSSLPRDAQHQEILRTKLFLQSLHGTQISDVFSIPFGDVNDFNEDTLGILADLQYRGALLSRQRFNWRLKKQTGIFLIERFMPKDSTLPRHLLPLPWCW